jgi:hypothetical protein
VPEVLLIAASQHQLKLLFFDFFLQLVKIFEIGQLVFVPPDEGHLVDRSKGGEECLEVILVEMRSFLQRFNFKAKLLGMHFRTVIFMVVDCFEVVRFPDEIEEE